MADQNFSPTPYDDVFRTLLNDCSGLIIPVINELFGESYAGDEQIVFSPDEHFQNRQDGGESKRITDTNFSIIGKTRKRYHLECESTVDYTVLVRIFEYDAQIALDQGSEVAGNKITVSFPNTAVLFLRSTEATPDEMEAAIRTPRGDVSYGVPVMKAKVYSSREIFEKKLLFLLPFHIFAYEGRFPEIEGDAGELSRLEAEYAGIAERLEGLAGKGEINEFQKRTIMDMSGRVLAHLASKHEKIRKGVGAVMSGQVLDYEAKRILNEGRREGIEEGRREGMEEGHRAGMEEGRQEGIIETLAGLVKDGLLSIQDAARRAGIPESVFARKMGAK